MRVRRWKISWRWVVILAAWTGALYGVDCRELLSALPKGVRAEAKWSHLQSYFSAYRASSVPQNRKYLRYFEVAAKKGHLAVAVEFPIVGSLNNYLDEKSKTGALWGLYKYLLMEGLRRHPLLSESIVRSRGIPVLYADFKSVGFVLTKDTPAMRAAVLEVQNQVAETYHQFLRLDEVRELEESGRSILQNTLGWTQWGLGHNPLQATVAARVGKYHVAPAGVLHPLDYHDPEIQEFFRSKFQGVETTRRHLVEALTARGALGKQIFVQVPNGEEALWVPSVQLWSVLKTLSNHAQADYYAALRDAIELNFKTRLDLPELKLIQRYFHLIEIFQPKIYERAESTVETADLKHGALYIDVRAQAARNFFQMGVSLAKAAERSAESENLVEDLTLALREGQRRESRNFEKLRRQGKNLAARHGYSTQTRVSGDEIIAPIPSADSHPHFPALLIAAAKAHAPFRAVEMRGGTRQFAGTHVKVAEALERKLRVRLRNSGYSFEELDGVMLGMEVAPKGTNSATIRVVVASAAGREASAKIESLLHHWLIELPIDPEAWVPDGYRLKDVSNAYTDEPLPDLPRAPLSE